MSQDLRSRVLASAAELNYQVNLLGRALRQKRHPVVGLTVPDLDNPFFASLTEHLSRTMRAANYELLVSSAGGSVEAEAEGVRAFLGRQVHAVVIIPCDEALSASTVQFASQQALTIQFDRKVDDANAAYVGCDNLHGMDLIADYVHNALGPDQPLHFVGAGMESSSARERLQGFQRHFPDAPTMLGNFSHEWGVTAAKRILEQGVSSGIIVAAADVIALGLISGLRTNGYRVPKDFQVIGFDGVGPAAFAHPPLLTIQQPVEAMCESILKLVQEGSSDSHEEDESFKFKPVLVGGDHPTA
nr:LacI family DNA-binding transcriptional regulator [Bowdeniella massiliensis]